MTDLALFFRLNVEHTYFKNKKNPNIGFMPVGLSVLLISKYMLYFLERKDGFDLYMDMKQFDLLSEILAEENIDHLEFMMILNDRNFLNYTELDIPKGSFILLKNSNTSDPDKVPIVLHQADFVSGKDLVDLSPKNGGNIPREYFLKPNSFALIHIPFRKEDNRVSLTAGDGKLISSSGAIKFNARSTFWKYLIYIREDLQFDSIQITDPRGQINFSEIRSEEDPEGRKVYITESNVKIPLQEISDYQFQLKGKQNGIEQILISRLAEPNPDNLSRDKGNLFSSIFIYY